MDLAPCMPYYLYTLHWSMFWRWLLNNLFFFLLRTGGILQRPFFGLLYAAFSQMRWAIVRATAVTMQLAFAAPEHSSRTGYTICRQNGKKYVLRTASKAIRIHLAYTRSTVKTLWERMVFYDTCICKCTMLPCTKLPYWYIMHSQLGTLKH